MALNLDIHSPLYDDREYDQVPYLEAVATWDQEQENLVVFAVNRNPHAALAMQGAARALSDYRVVQHLTLTRFSHATCLVGKVRFDDNGAVMNTHPDRFARTMVELYGEAGTEWLRRLPNLLADCAQRWSLVVQPALPNLTFNYVAPAVRADGTSVILKVGFPNRELAFEMEALRVYDGQGIVQLLDSDRELGALLLERLEPGTPLSLLDDDQASTSVAAQVMRTLHCPAPEGSSFRSVADWTAGLYKLRPHFGGTTGPFPAFLVDTAQALLAELIPTMAEPVLLHGDLHHDNILAATRQPWLALDPKGIVGEPAYEVGPFLHNPMPQIATWPNLDRILARRVDQFADELGLGRERLLSWGIVQAVLSAWWSVEDQGYGWEPALAVAETLAGL